MIFGSARSENSAAKISGASLYWHIKSYFTYRISSFGFGNPKVTVHKCAENYSRAETIWGNTYLENCKWPHNFWTKSENSGHIFCGSSWIFLPLMATLPFREYNWDIFPLLPLIELVRYCLFSIEKIPPLSLFEHFLRILFFWFVISFFSCFIPKLLDLLMSNPKPSLQIGTPNAICWNSLGLFRDYGLKYIFLGIKLFCFSR